MSSIHWVYSDSDRAGGEGEEEGEGGSGEQWRCLLGRAHQRHLYSPLGGEHYQYVHVLPTIFMYNINW